jgi:acyl-ACP--UDP-N-acetylglucosamine O-acyltransferase
MSVRIHPAAFVDPNARLGVDVTIGPGAVIGPDVVIGNRTRVDSHALVTGWTTLGSDNHVHHGAVLGSAPQDLKYLGEPSYLVIGDHSVFREYCTANLATEPGFTTRIGSHVLMMASRTSRITAPSVIGSSSPMPSSWPATSSWMTGPSSAAAPSCISSPASGVTP